MPWLPTNLYVTGYVEHAPRLTLDSVVVTQNKHDATNNNGVITCDVSEETTLAGNKPSGSFNSVQELKDPYKLEAFNVALPSWTDDRGKPSKYGQTTAENPANLMPITANISTAVQRSICTSSMIL